MVFRRDVFSFPCRYMLVCVYRHAKTNGREESQEPEVEDALPWSSHQTSPPYKRGLLQYRSAVQCSAHVHESHETTVGHRILLCAATVWR